MPGGEKELIVELKLDRTQSKREQRAHADEQKRIETEIAAHAEQVSRDAHGRFVRRNQQRVEDVVKASRTVSEAIHQEKRAFEASGAASVASYSKMGVAAAAATLAFQGVLRVVNSIGAAVTDAGERSRRLTTQFGDERDQLRELAGLMERSPDSKFALEMARFSAKTGLTTPERNEFLTQLINSGAQFKGKNISAAEFSQFGEQAGALALAKGLTPGVAGEVAGGLLGLTNFDKFGGAASENATGVLNQVLMTLGRGKGDNPVLARQFAMLASASLSENQLQGVFQRPEEVAAVVSVAAEKSQAQAAELAKMAGRGLRDFSNPMIQKAGVTPRDSFIQAFGKISQLATQEVQARQATTPGFKVEDFLRENIKDEGTIDAFNVFLNKGITGGGFADRLGFAQANAGPDVAAQVVESFFGTETGQRRLKQGQLAESQAGRAAKISPLELVRLDATRRLIDRGELDTNVSGIKDYLINATSFGILGNAEQLRIDTEAQRLLIERSPAGTKAGAFADNFNITPLARQDDLLQRMDRIRAAGGDPTRDAGETNAILRDIRDALKGPGGAAGPGGAVVPPPRMPGPPMANPQRRPGP